MIHTIMLVLLVLLLCGVWFYERSRTAQLRRTLAEAEKKITWLDTRMREGAEIRAAFSAINQERVRLDRQVREAEDEIHWLRCTLRHYGFGHLLSREPDSWLWDMTGAPAPSRAYTFLDPCDEDTDPGTTRSRKKC